MAALFITYFIGLRRIFIPVRRRYISEFVRKILRILANYKSNEKIKIIFKRKNSKFIIACCKVDKIHITSVCQETISLAKPKL